MMSDKFVKEVVRIIEETTKDEGVTVEYKQRKGEDFEVTLTYKNFEDSSHVPHDDWVRYDIEASSLAKTLIMRFFYFYFEQKIKLIKL